MATIKTNTNNTYYAVLTLTEGSYNIEANTSPVRYSLTLYNGIQNFSGYTIGYEILINGVQVAYQNNSGNQTSMAANSSKTVATGSTTITHDADGSKTISASVRIWTNNMSYLPVSLSGSGNMALATIPRASTPTLSASNFNAGSALTITTNRASSSFTHTLKYTLNGTTGTIATGVGASYTWSDTKALAGLIPNATSGTVKITCETYNGTTHIGTKTVNVTVKVPETADYMPTVSSVVVTDANGYAEKYSGYVQGKSAPTVTITAVSTYSTIKSYKVEFQGTTLSGKTNVVSLATVNATGLLDVVVTVTDGRGRTATKTAQITGLGYNSPTVSAKAIRCNSDGTANDEGAYIKVSCSASIVPLNDANSKNIKLQYKKKSATSWTTHKTWTVYTVNEDVVISASTDSSYDIQLVATDDFILDSPAIFITELGTVDVLMDFNASGKGISFGKVSEKDGFEVDMEAEFYQHATFSGAAAFNGGLTVDGTGVVKKTVTVTTEGTDLNDYTEDGTYFFASSVTPTNIPAGVNGWLQVITAGDGGSLFTKQIWYRAGTLNSNDYQTFIRTRSNSGSDWSDWVMLDVIIEQGVSGIWSYKKYASGVAECWGRYTDSSASMSAETPLVSGTMAIGSGSYSTNYPSDLFNAEPKCFCNYQGAYSGSTYYASFIFFKGKGSKTATPTFGLARLGGKVSTTLTAVFDFHAIGTWK